MYIFIQNLMCRRNLGVAMVVGSVSIVGAGCSTGQNAISNVDGGSNQPVADAMIASDAPRSPVWLNDGAIPSSDANLESRVADAMLDTTIVTPSEPDGGNDAAVTVPPAEWTTGPVLGWSATSQAINVCLSPDGQTLAYSLYGAAPTRFEVRRWISGAWQRVWFADRLFGGDREQPACSFSYDGQRMAVAHGQSARIFEANPDDSYRPLAQLSLQQAGDEFTGPRMSADGRTVLVSGQHEGQLRVRTVHVFEDVEGQWQNWVRRSITYPNDLSGMDPYLGGLSLSQDGTRALIGLRFSSVTTRNAVIVEKRGDQWIGRYTAACTTPWCSLSSDGTEANACSEQTTINGVRCETRNHDGALRRSFDVVYRSIEDLGPNTHLQDGFGEPRIAFSWRGTDAFFTASMTSYVVGQPDYDFVGLKLYVWRDGRVVGLGSGGSIGGSAAVSADGRVAVVANQGRAQIETFLR